MWAVPAWLAQLLLGPSGSQCYVCFLGLSGPLTRGMWYASNSSRAQTLGLISVESPRPFRNSSFLSVSEVASCGHQRNWAPFPPQRSGGALGVLFGCILETCGFCTSEEFAAGSAPALHFLSIKTLLSVSVKCQAVKKTETCQ